jgi:hypothetical protein
MVISWSAVFDGDPERRRRLIAMAEACLAALRALERLHASTDQGRPPTTNLPN